MHMVNTRYCTCSTLHQHNKPGSQIRGGEVCGSKTSSSEAACALDNRGSQC